VSRIRVLFICTHNSARSQMAEGILNHLYGDRFEAYSAGTHPTRVNPLAIKALKEIGIDISHHRSTSVEEFKGSVFDVVVTVCDDAMKNCPFFPGKKVFHRSFPDPSESNDIEVFRSVRDSIIEWIKDFFGSGKFDL